jgi:hypothetical protein
MIMAIISAYVFYCYIFEPYVLQPLCFVDSNACVRFGYYSYNNSALVDMRGSGVWLWYNGDNAYIYGQPVGQLCKDPTRYQAAYVINTHTGRKEGYQCVISLDEVKKFYTEKGIQMRYLLKSIGTENFDVYSALNLLDQEGVITLK